MSASFSDATKLLRTCTNGRPSWAARSVIAICVVLPGSFARILLRHFLDLRHDLNEVVRLRVLQRWEFYI